MGDRVYGENLNNSFVTREYTKENRRQFQVSMMVNSIVELGRDQPWPAEFEGWRVKQPGSQNEVFDRLRSVWGFFPDEVMSLAVHYHRTGYYVLSGTNGDLRDDRCWVIVGQIGRGTITFKNGRRRFTVAENGVVESRDLRIDLIEKFDQKKVIAWMELYFATLVSLFSEGVDSLGGALMTVSLHGDVMFRLRGMVNATATVDADEFDPMLEEAKKTVKTRGGSNYRYGLLAACGDLIGLTPAGISHLKGLRMDVSPASRILEAIHFARGPFQLSLEVGGSKVVPISDADDNFGLTISTLRHRVTRKFVRGGEMDIQDDQIYND